MTSLNTFTLLLPLLLLFISSPSHLAHAHGRMKTPVPLGFNETPKLTGIGYNWYLNADGSDFPCKGVLGQFPHKPSGVYKAGNRGYMEIQGNELSYHGPKLRPTEGQLGAHSGGSCQVSFSFDNGTTFKVLHSYIGGCPRGALLGKNQASDNQRYLFDVPADTRAGEAILSWTWIPRTGNRMEFYQNCAIVMIEGEGTSTLDDFPDMYVGEMMFAQIGDGMCRSVPGVNLEYPDPGQPGRVTRYDDPETPALPPTGPGPNGNFDVCKAPGSYKPGRKRSLGKGRRVKRPRRAH